MLSQNQLKPENGNSVFEEGIKNVMLSLACHLTDDNSRANRHDKLQPAHEKWCTTQSLDVSVVVQPPQGSQSES